MMKNIETQIESITRRIYELNNQLLKCSGSSPGLNMQVLAAQQLLGQLQRILREIGSIHETELSEETFPPLEVDYFQKY